jgi:hypothetical protein
VSFVTREFTRGELPGEIKREKKSLTTNDELSICFDDKSYDNLLDESCCVCAMSWASTDEESREGEGFELFLR